jgi:hypothetical protein
MFFKLALFSFALITQYVSSTEKNMLKRQYIYAFNHPTDINEHLGLLCKLAKECSSVTELGLRGTESIWGLLQGLAESPSSFRSYLGIAFMFPSGRMIRLAERLANENNISFRLSQVHDEYSNIEPTDMLFIDSFHTYCHLTFELESFCPYVNKYIAMHYTSFPWGAADEAIYFENPIQYPTEYDRNKRGLWPAVQDFLQRHPEWLLLERRVNNHGLTVLKRKSLEG